MTKRLSLAWPVPSREIRSDSEGDGHFGAPRGARLHRGIDIVAPPGTKVIAPCDCIVDRFGWCYKEPPNYRLIQLRTVGWEATIRLLYIYHFCVDEGWTVSAGQPIGVVDNLSKRYGEAMVNHVHMEMHLMDWDAEGETGVVLAERGEIPHETQWLNPLLFLED